MFAALVLLWVGIWMHGKSHADAWQRYIRDKLGHALNRRSAWFVFGLAFFVAAPLLWLIPDRRIERIMEG